MNSRWRSGQAMIETVIAVLIITSFLVLLFSLSHMLMTKICLGHAALRAARAQAVGLNEYMCVKAARLAVVPVAGERLWPLGEEFDLAMERGRFANYTLAKDESIARGILEYEYWQGLRLNASGEAVEVRMTKPFKFEGRGEVRSECDLYLTSGL